MGYRYSAHKRSHGNLGKKAWYTQKIEKLEAENAELNTLTAMLQHDIVELEAQIKALKRDDV